MVMKSAVFRRLSRRADSPALLALDRVRAFALSTLKHALTLSTHTTQAR